VSRRGRYDAERIADILEAISKIELWSASHERNDDRYRSAVMRELGVIGEAINGLSDGLRSEYPEIPWRSIVGLRNVLSHHYWDTSWALIEQVLNDDLKRLRRSIVSVGSSATLESDLKSAQASPANSTRTCGRWMPRARSHCILLSGHAGACRSL
jgi:uncharacterized protein with HEPN domain